MADQTDGRFNDPKFLTKVYIRMRDKKAEINAEAEAKVKHIDEQMKVIEGQLLALLGDNNSMSNDYGSVTRITKEHFWCSDWDNFKSFVVEHLNEGSLDLYEHRLAQKNTKAFLEQHPGVVPPGLQADRRFGVRVTRKSSKPGEE
jgi:hypothetical protein